MIADLIAAAGNHELAITQVSLRQHARRLGKEIPRGRVEVADDSPMLDAIGALLMALVASVASRSDLVAENMVLRQQLAIFRWKVPRPRLRAGDRCFWLLMRRLWGRWSDVLVLVRPETVVRWHHAGFRAFWRWKSAHRPGCPREDAKVCALIIKMANDNPTWGAPRIHGELLKLGFALAQSTVSKYLPKKRRPPDEIVRQRGAHSSPTT